MAHEFSWLTGDGHTPRTRTDKEKWLACSRGQDASVFCDECEDVLEVDDVIEVYNDMFGAKHVCDECAGVLMNNCTNSDCLCEGLFKRGEP